MARSIMTRYMTCSAWSSRLILAAMVGLVLYGCLWAHGSSFVFVPPAASNDTKSHDVDMYRAVADRVRAGEGYYQAAGTELRSRGYATRPFFNWRLPLLGSFMGRLPSTDAAMPVAGTIAGLTLIVWLIVLARQEMLVMVVAAGVLLVRGLLPAIWPPGFLFHELWTGLLIALSIGLHGLGWRPASVAAGVLALFIRELALPFVIVMFAMACYDRHRREAWAWAAGIAAFGTYLTMHALHVNGLLTAADYPHEGWLQLNGWGFVLATAWWNTLLTGAPSWLAALAVPASMLGLAGWRGPTGLRAAVTVGTYMCVFAIAGRSCNFYWGLVYAPLLSLGIAYAPWALFDLLQSAKIMARESSIVPAPAEVLQRPVGATPDRSEGFKGTAE